MHHPTWVEIDTNILQLNLPDQIHNTSELKVSKFGNLMLNLAANSGKKMSINNAA